MPDLPRSADLGRADDALVRLRRLWSPEHTRLVDHDGRRVEMSSVLVVEVCARAGPDGLAVGGIAGQLAVEASTASRLVDRAVRAGLVERARSAADARRSVIHLTAAGSTLRESALAFRLAWLGGILADWPAADVATFAGMLGRFADAVAEAGPPGPG
ncbi:MAG TPA: MarR family winged helix-turn-helix transcriptional regulator [Pseudonocardia sp.]|nr:MarR family winged helix-turn-helix transcriptional regulator [Pseudonocardia sp.]